MTGSYGILNVDPLGFKLDKEVSPFDKAMSTASGMYDLFGKHYENKLRGSEANLKNLEAQQKASTMPGLIQSINAKSAADTKFYPMQQEADLGRTNAQINELMTKGGLNRAEATAAVARAGESNAMAGLHRQNTSNAGMYGQAMDQYYKDTRFGSKRSGAGGTYVDPQTGQVMSTPTNAVTTQNQKTIMANERVKPLIQDLIKNNSQFQTAKQKGALEAQRVGNYFGGNYPLPDQYAQGQQDLKLAPESMLKGYGLNVTNESLQTMEKALEPIRGETKNGYEKRLQKTLSSISENQQQAMNAQSQGMNVTPQQPPVAQGFNGNPSLPPDQQGGQQQPQIQATKSLGDSEYVQINGQWYHK